MSVIADVSIPADQFALGSLLEVRPGVKVRLETMIPTSGAMIPYFWVESPDADAVEAALRESPTVEEVLTVDDIGDETLFRVQWSEDIDGLIEALSNFDVVVLEGVGHGDHWTFQLRFPEYDTLSTFYRTLVDKDISVDLSGINNPMETSQGLEFGLTPEQREVLLLALDEGYFSVPREVTLVELAEMLDISDSAVSQRLRRGLTKVLAQTVGVSP
ncbi:MAG: helix-turn-helix domain-containing protein [Haloarculaceae archaeon]